VIDIDVVVVIRFETVEIMPRERLAQEKGERKQRLAARRDGVLGAGRQGVAVNG
jgi:hypothetical protein